MTVERGEHLGSTYCVTHHRCDRCQCRPHQVAEPYPRLHGIPRPPGAERGDRQARACPHSFSHALRHSSLISHAVPTISHGTWINHSIRLLHASSPTLQPLHVALPRGRLHLRSRGRHHAFDARPAPRWRPRRRCRSRLPITLRDCHLARVRAHPSVSPEGNSASFAPPAGLL